MSTLLDSSVGLIYSISAKSDTSELKKFEAETDKIGKSGANSLDAITSSSGAAGAGLLSMVNPATLAASAVTAIASASVAVGITLFDLAKSAADAGSQINDASEKTGLAATSLSAMKFAADQSGTSLEAVTAATGKFSRLVGEAAQGSDEAAEKLKRLGISPQEAIKNLDSALGKVFERIVSLPPGIAQATAAQQAFGRSGIELLPFIKSFDGDLPGLIAKAKELGVVLSDSDAKAADMFGDSLDTLKAQAHGVANQFALQFLPVLTNGMQSLSRLFSQNKDEVKVWGTAVANTITGVIVSLGALVSFYESHPFIARLILAGGTLGASEIVIGSVQTVEKIGADANKVTSIADLRRSEDTNTKDNKIFGDDDYLKEGTKKVKSTLNTFDKEFRKFADDIDFTVSRTFGKNLQGKPGGSLHPSGLAGDLSIKGKSVEEIVTAIAEGIKNGWRALDERFVGALPGIKSTGPNAHFEVNPRKASMFVENRPDLYGGADNLAYLKKLDADRLAGKTSSDEIAAFTKKRVEDEKRANEEIVKNNEEASNRVLERAKQDAAEELAINKDLLARKKITQDEFDKRSEASDIELLNKEKILLEDRLSLAKEFGVGTVQIEEQIASVTSQIKVKQSEAETAAYLKSKKYLEDLKALRLETAKVERDLLDVQKEGERTSLERQLNAAIGAEARLNALVVLQEFELAENDRRQKQDTEDAQRERDAALQAIEDKVKEKEKVEEINRLYRDRLDIINQIHQNNEENIKAQTQPDIDAATGEATGGIWGGLAGILGGAAGGGVDPTNQIKKQADYIKAVYGDLASMSKQAIGSMVQGLGQLVATWISTGKFSAKAALQLVSGIASGLAIEAGLKALMEYAEGMAMAANPFTAYLAAGHFLAAQAYGVAALAAGAVGVGTGLTARAFGNNQAGATFNQQTATGANNPATGGVGSGRSFTGGAWSSSGDEVTTYESGANNSTIDGEITVNVKISERSGWLSEAIMFEMGTNMDFRRRMKNQILDENH